jgi:hypothetical protein
MDSNLMPAISELDTTKVGYFLVSDLILVSSKLLWRVERGKHFND